ncbi:MAG: hypothetical protein K9N09_12380, partial [Candidatus Cloacimonetes bacterium]|nr:hypothetical protein [Candidatus Cloacimonadota bacterium]MCF7815403.1 hypothetical protein [Candidatus Cloacimonadota bacterium]MCF7869481.1 hypothetical protein [Candidatus Cloacimonadota bacterium]MCF7884842.1 hypothetical protein [Candidatus Cloacimonadota bacterium]
SQPVNTFLDKYFLGTFSPFPEEFVLFFKHLAHYFCGFGCFFPKLGLDTPKQKEDRSSSKAIINIAPNYDGLYVNLTYRF